MSIHRYLASALAVAAAIALATGSSQAQCPTVGYASITEVLNPPADVPDNDPTGITLGPFVTPADGQFFTDVIAGLKMSHTWIGDLIATLTYDLTCDGTPEASARLMCRAGSTECAVLTDVQTGCGADLLCTNNYMFSDAGVLEAGDPANCRLSSIVASGCYRTSVVANMPLSVFDGLMKGGCFRLMISDHFDADVGAVCQWSVHYTSTGPTAAQSSTWGELKTRYR